MDLQMMIYEAIRKNDDGTYSRCLVNLEYLISVSSHSDYPPDLKQIVYPIEMIGYEEGDFYFTKESYEKFIRRIG